MKKTYTIYSYVNGECCIGSEKVFSTLAEAKKNFPNYREIAEMMNQERRNGGKLYDEDEWRYVIEREWEGLEDPDDDLFGFFIIAVISLTWGEAKQILGY